MKIIFSFFFILVFSSSINAQKIATIKISYLITNSIVYSDFIKKLNITKKSFTNNLKVEEEKLIFQEKNIEDSKLILDDISLNKLIETYNIEINKYQKKINNFNNEIDQVVNFNQNIIVNEIIPIVQLISETQNIDIVLNEDQYFLSAQNNDISEFVLKELNKKKIELKIFKTQ